MTTVAAVKMKTDNFTIHDYGLLTVSNRERVDETGFSSLSNAECRINMVVGVVSVLESLVYSLFCPHQNTL